LKVDPTRTLSESTVACVRTKEQKLRRDADGLACLQIRHARLWGFRKFIFN
jgi:hypothetical protein